MGCINQWAWLVANLRVYGVLDYFDLHACERYADCVLTLKGRKCLTNIYVIKRTSKRVYRLMHYKNNNIDYKTFDYAKTLCEFIVKAEQIGV